MFPTAANPSAHNPPADDFGTAIFPAGNSPPSTDNSNLDPLDWDDHVEEGSGDHNPPDGEVAEPGTSVKPIDLTTPADPLAEAAAGNIQLVEKILRDNNNNNNGTHSGVA